MDTQQSESPHPIPGSTHDILFSKRQLILCGFLLIVASGFGGVLLGKYLRIPNARVPVVQTPISITTSDFIANWKVYTNEKLGFEIKLPPDITFEEILLTRAEARGALNVFVMAVSRPPRVTYKTIPICPKEPKTHPCVLSNSNKEKDVTEITLDRIPAVSFRYWIDATEYRRVIQTTADDPIEIEFGSYLWPEEKGTEVTRVRDQILSTFKFLDQNISQECGVCGPRGDHNLNGSQCAPGLECTNVGEDVYMGQELRLIGSSVYFCVKPGESISKCVPR